MLPRFSSADPVLVIWKVCCTLCPTGSVPKEKVPGVMLTVGCAMMYPESGTMSAAAAPSVMLSAA